ncbi:MAG: hypothetical protein QOH13_2128, partial [Thermoleophilaceae bacterium]|nr:hypothetical protein [Thermoleophilaceae bacterium]
GPPAAATAPEPETAAAEPPPLAQDPATEVIEA